MPVTELADVFVPSVLARATNLETARRSRFMAAGILVRTPEFDALASGLGLAVGMPRWSALSGPRQLITSQPFETQVVRQVLDRAVINNDGQSWGVHDLVPKAGGQDAIAAAAAGVGSWRAYETDLYVSEMLTGIFKSESMSGNLLAIAEENPANYWEGSCLNAKTFIDATAKLGDASSLLEVLVVRSEVEAFLRKLNLVNDIPSADGKGIIAVYQGRRLVVCDTLTVDNTGNDGTAYYSYLCGKGAMAYGESTAEMDPLSGGTGTWGYELAREALSHTTRLIHRRRYLCHTRGVAAVGDAPSNLDLRNAARHERAFDNKDIRVVAVRHNIGSTKVERPGA